MTQALGALAARIRLELEAIDWASELAQKRWHKALADEDYLGSVVLDLQGFYQGIERCLEMVAKTVDGASPSGDQWHQVLLAHMAEDLPGVRPAVLAVGTREVVDRFRRFRHVARHAYGFNLDAAKVAALIQDLPAAARLVRQDLIAFADFLEVAATRHPG